MRVNFRRLFPILTDLKWAFIMFGRTLKLGYRDCDFSYSFRFFNMMLGDLEKGLGDSKLWAAEERDVVVSDIKIVRRCITDLLDKDDDDADLNLRTISNKMLSKQKNFLRWWS